MGSATRQASSTQASTCPAFHRASSCAPISHQSCGSTARRCRLAARGSRAASARQSSSPCPSLRTSRVAKQIARPRQRSKRLPRRPPTGALRRARKGAMPPNGRPRESPASCLDQGGPATCDRTSIADHETGQAGSKPTFPSHHLRPCRGRQIPRPAPLPPRATRLPPRGGRSCELSWSPPRDAAAWHSLHSELMRH